MITVKTVTGINKTYMIIPVGGARKGESRKDGAAEQKQSPMDRFNTGQSGNNSGENIVAS